MRHAEGIRSWGRRLEILKYSVEVFSTLTVLAVFVPLRPNLPSIYREAYPFAINQAVAQGLVFGRDIVFTYGPYASILTKEYHPATDWRMLWGSLFLGVCYSFVLALLGAVMNRRWILVLYAGFCAGLMSQAVTPDALISSYPLLLALLTYRMTSPDARTDRYFSLRFKVAFGALFLPLGLLPLIKVSFLLICGSMAICSLFFLLHGKQKRMAWACALLPLGIGVFFWRLSGQPISGIPDFFMNTRPIISGYTQAQSIAGNFMEVILYLIVSAFVLYAAAREPSTSTVHKRVMGICFALFLYIAFKQGFVRHDAHVLTASASLVFAALSGALVLRTKPAILVMVLLSATIVCGYIDNHYVPFSPEGIYTSARKTYQNAWDGLRLRLSGPSALRDQFDDALAQIAKQVPIHPLQGTVDIYSIYQSSLFASGHAWSPRPIFLSYSVYTPELARLNADHLTREHKMPDNILFRVDPVDGRLPALEDGLSWPILINNYSVAGTDNFFVYLKKRGAPAGDPPSAEIYKAEHTLGSAVLLPGTKDAVFAQIDVEPSLLGKLMTILYKPPALGIFVSLADGRIKSYRFIPGMGSAGFILSPLVEDTNGFLMLTANREYLANNIVRSFRISSVDGESLFWKKRYSVTLKTLELVRETRLTVEPGEISGRR
jgi:hypothetical protein